ncbi:MULTISPECIES: hypothetical protein [Bacteroides]|uniref:hypothetical protein n=1 Tax=Bacteroides TaxID=816 RepID=UPI000B375817|nr:MULTISPECIES: hypothetical protein [Bacteroides]MBM6944043.1 hypothetical protein [Bacteroides gallinaceum]OUO62852.1 hypothetical protein B5F78_02915 [Bacteroides sp. An279]
MAKEYRVHSEMLQSFLSGIEDVQLRERYKMFLSLHEHIHYQYSKDNSEPIQELRVAAEALCKLLIFIYVPNADQLFSNTDNLSHTYLKVIGNGSSSEYLKIKEVPLNTPSVPHQMYCDKTVLGQLAYALLCKKDEKENGQNPLYNKITECYKNLYAPLNTDTSHAVPSAKQSLYDASTLYSFYFSWVRSMIDLCSDKLSELKDLLPFENTVIEENVKKDIELEQLISEDESLKELNELEGDFKHEYGKKYILIVSATLKPELKASLARISWNMVIDFDPRTQAEGGLFYTIKNKWEGKRQMLYSEVETNGDKITYWVQANGNMNNEAPCPEDQPKMWRRIYLPIIEEKIEKLSFQKPEGEIVIVDLYSQSKFPEVLYKSSKLPLNMRIIRLLSSKEYMISDITKDQEIDAEVREYIVDQMQLTRYFGSLNSNVLENSSEFTSGCPEITVEDVNKLAAYDIECVPQIPLSQEKKELGIGFCSGKRITWDELYADIDVKRFGYDNFYKKIAENVKKGDTFVGYIKHSPCSGGTTVARRLAYDLMNKDTNVSSKCYVVFLTELKSTSSEVFQKIKTFIEDTLPPTRMLIIFIDRTISDDNIENLKKNYISPTHKVSIVRITYGSIPKKVCCLTINDSLMPDEIPNFNRLYERLCTGISGIKLKNVIDFPLSVKNNSQSVDDYVQGWMKEIDQEYQEDIQHFSILVSVASLYIYDYDRYVSTGFTDSIFEKKISIWNLVNVMSKSSQIAFEKLFDIEYNDENKRTGRIRPRFSLFAKSIISKSNIGIYDISKDYLEHISNWDATDKMKYIYDVFLKRPDFEMDEIRKISLNEKVSSFFKSNECDSETILEVYKLLVNYFPDDENCLLSYSQFLYNKAYFEDKESHDGNPFIESENILLRLLEGRYGKLFDSLIYQSLGVLYYRKIGVLRDILFGKDLDAFTLDLYKCVLQYHNNCSEFCDKSTELDPTSAYGLVTKAQMLKAVLNATQKYKQYKDWTFCEVDNIYQNMYLDYLDACSKIARFIPDEEGNIRTNYKLNDIYNKLDDFRKKLNGGEGKDFFDKYDKKLKSTTDEKLKIIYGCRLYDTVISSKRKGIRESIDKLNDRYISRIEEATRYNARKGVSGAYEKLLKLMIFNSRSDSTIEEAIELLKEWEKSTNSNAEHLWINYYFMVFYTVQILNNGYANEGLMKRYNEVREKARKYCEAADQKEYDTYPYLFYKKSQGLESITEEKDKASFVQGTIKEITLSNRRRGKAKLDCGLEATFSAKDEKYDDADINVTRIEGVIGFRFSGLGLYKQDIIIEPIEDEEPEEDSSQTANFTENDRTGNNLPNDYDTTTVSIQQPVVKGYMDLSTIEDGTKKRFASANLEIRKEKKEYEGEIVLEGRYKKIRCDSFPYSLPIEGRDLNEFYEGDKVIFVVKSRPQDKNPSKPYRFATNLRLKED